MTKSRKLRKSRRRQRRRGGAQLEGAPLNYSLAGDYASNASMSQGQDFFKHHLGQHGGCALTGAPLSAIESSALDASLRGPAHLGGIDKAYADIAGLRDMNGGRRRKSKKGGRRHKRGSRCRKNKSKKGGKRGKRYRRTRRRGGAMGYSPYPGQGMLLSGAEYAQAGLNPEWQNAQEFNSAMMRGSM